MLIWSFLGFWGTTGCAAFELLRFGGAGSIDPRSEKAAFTALRR